MPAFKGDVGQGGQHVEDQQAKDRAIAGGPRDPQTLDRPERPERRQQGADNKLQQAARDTANRVVQGKADPANGNNGAGAAKYGGTQVVRTRPKGNDDEGQLESLKNDAFEGEKTAGPGPTRTHR